MSRKTFPRVQFQRGNAYDDLAGEYGAFPLASRLSSVCTIRVAIRRRYRVRRGSRIAIAIPYLVI